MAIEIWFALVSLLKATFRREKTGREKRENGKREELENIIKSPYQPVSEVVAEALEATKAAGKKRENGFISIVSSLDFDDLKKMK